MKHTEKTNNVKTLTPGHMTEMALLESTSKKRKQKDVDTKEVINVSMLYFKILLHTTRFEFILFGMSSLFLLTAIKLDEL